MPAVDEKNQTDLFTFLEDQFEKKCEHKHSSHFENRECSVKAVARVTWSCEAGGLNICLKCVMAFIKWMNRGDRCADCDKKLSDCWRIDPL